MNSTFKKSFYLFLISLLPSISLIGQAPPGSSSARTQNVNVAPAGGSHALDSNTAPLMTDKLFNTDKDSIDFEDGRLNWKGKTFNIGQNRAVRMRFERYLASEGLDEDDQAYLKVLAEVEEKLRIVNDSGYSKDPKQVKKDVISAWEQLFKAGQFRIDTGTSFVLADAVNNVWRVKEEASMQRYAERRLDEESKKMQDRILQSEFWEKKEHEELQLKTAHKRHTGKAYKAIGEKGFQTAELSEIEAKLKGLAGKQVQSGFEAKVQYQSILLQFVTARRYQHTNIGAAFYNHLFKASHQGLEVGKAQLEEFLPNSNMNPTVDLLESISRETMNDVVMGMSVVESNYNNGNLWMAMERLQETFFLGEYLPVVMQFDPAKKAEILEIFRLSMDLETLMDLKDWDAMEDVVNKISSKAKDFQTAVYSSGINKAKRLSNMKVLSAKQAIAMQNYQKAESDMEAATEIWPLNPEIKSLGENIVDFASEGAGNFDKLYQSSDFRKIYDNRNEFGVALLNDPVRRKQLRTVVDDFAQIDILLAQAEVALKQNNPYAAWEFIASAEKVFADDVKVLKLKSSVAMRANNLVQKLEEGRLAEERGDYAVALTQYLRAQDVYPASEQSRLGIERVAETLLEQLK